VLRSAFEVEVDHILDSLEPSQPGEDDDRCATGDSTYVTGKRIDRDASHLVLLASDPRSMIVRCNMQQ
jgi:hypothetical protein